MSFKIADFSGSDPELCGGQSFTPNIPGPDGAGGPTGAKVIITTFSVGYRDYNTAARACECFIYSQPLSSPDQIGFGPNLVARCVDGNFIDARDGFGPGTFSRIFVFIPSSALPMDVQTQYYAYLLIVEGQFTPQLLMVSADDVYSGGAMINGMLDLDPDQSVQFCAEFLDASGE